MTEALLEAFAVLFVTIGPIDNAAMFAAMTKGTSSTYRRKMAIKSILIATSILLVFALFGDDILHFFGVHISSLEIAGGLLLLIVSIKMVMSDETVEVKSVDEARDISVFPLAMPLIAGPDALVAVVLQISQAKDETMLQVAIIGVIIFILALVFVACILSGSLVKILGNQGIEIITRILGLLLATLSIEFIIDGLAHSVLYAKIAA